MNDLDPDDREIVDLLRSFRSRGSRLVLDIPTLIAMQEAIDQVVSVESCKGHGYVRLEIKQYRFYGLETGTSRLFPQEKLRKSS